MDSKSSSYTRKKEELLVELPKLSIPQLGSSTPSDLRFDRLQPSDQELVQEKRFQFGQFVAREAVLDEEYWVGDRSPNSCGVCFPCLVVWFYFHE